MAYGIFPNVHPDCFACHYGPGEFCEKHFERTIVFKTANSYDEKVVEALQWLEDQEDLYGLKVAGIAILEYKKSYEKKLRKAKRLKNPKTKN